MNEEESLHVRMFMANDGIKRERMLTNIVKLDRLFNGQVEFLESGSEKLGEIVQRN